jgi:Na+-driven multidrug efflux pump
VRLAVRKLFEEVSEKYILCNVKRSGSDEQNKYRHHHLRHHEEADQLLPSRNTIDSNVLEHGEGERNTVTYYYSKKWTKEALILMQLALPFALASVAWVAMKTTDTALLGHISKYGVGNSLHMGGSETNDVEDDGANKSYYLSVSSYADLWMSSTSVLLQGQVLGIFAGPCIESGNTTLVGIWLQVSLTCLSMISIFVMICFWCTKHVLLAIPGGGATLEIANDAQYYARVFIGAILARLLAIQLKQYLACQKIMGPSCIAALVGMVGNIVFGLYFALGIPCLPISERIGVPFGFKACPWVTTTIEWLQPAIVLWMIGKLGYKDNGIQTWPSSDKIKSLLVYKAISF